MSFRPRPVQTVFAALGMALLVGLGVWQLQRLQWKLGLIAKVEERIHESAAPFSGVLASWEGHQDTEYTPVVATGVFRNDLEAHVYGTLEGEAGYYIFTPLELSGADWPEGTFVYVNRGFAPLALKDPASRPDSEIDGPVTVKGLFRSPEREGGIVKMVAAKDDPVTNFWHLRDPALFSKSAGIAALPAYIDSFGGENPAPWPKGGTTRIDFTNRHLEYALTWFGLAAALFAVWLAYSLKRR
ncbi:MAG: SURF1 family protein [Parvularculaceae bacterium]